MRGRIPRAGFSLIELLVVVAVIAILAGLSFAMFRLYADGQRRMDKANWAAQRAMGKTPDRGSPLRVYFIGNSYTDANDLPGMIAALMAAAGNRPPMVSGKHLAGGATLSQHWDAPEVLPAIQSGDWDYVVLQDQSQRPVFTPAATDADVKRFAAEIRKAGATPMVFQTWERTDTPWPDMESALRQTYFDAAKSYECDAAPAGLAWKYAREVNPALPLQQSDGSHPTAHGSYLAACAFYAAMLNRSPEGLTGRLVVNGTVAADVSAADAAVMQQAAWRAHLAARKVLAPDWQKISTK